LVLRRGLRLLMAGTQEPKGTRSGEESFPAWCHHHHYLIAERFHHLKRRSGVVTCNPSYSVTPAILVGGLRSKASLGKTTRPYLKNN
jgi:hypothetical protein